MRSSRSAYQVEKWRSVACCARVSCDTTTLPTPNSPAAVCCPVIAGAGQHAGARAAVLLAIVVCQTLCSGLGAVLWLQPVFFARLFTTDAVIVDTVVACMPWVALELAGNGATVVVCGALRGAGRQLTGSCVNLVSYWCLGLPLGAYLGLVKGYGAPGLWMSLAAARLAQLVVLLGVLVWLDWEVEVAHSQQLIRSQSGSRVCSRQTSIDTSRPEAEGLLPHGRLGASMRLPETLPEERVWRAPVQHKDSGPAQPDTS